MTASEIKPGDKVRVGGLVGVVRAVEDGEAWILRPSGVHSTHDLSKLLKVEPRFEAGKTYMRRESAFDEGPVTVAAVNEKWAIGWWCEGGSPWQRQHEVFAMGYWEEVAS